MSVDLSVSQPPATADERLLAILRRELMVAREMLKSLSTVFASEESGSLLPSLLKEIEEHKRQAEILQQDFLDYFSRVAPSLSSREEWMGLFSKIGGVVDKLGGLAYRAEFLFTRPWKIPGSLRELLSGMLSLLLAMIDDCVTMMGAVLTHRGRAHEARSKVAEGERKMDRLYRSAIFSALSEAQIPAPAMLLLINVAELIEDTADLLNSAGDDLYLISLYATGS